MTTYEIPVDPITGEPSTQIIVRVDPDGRTWSIPTDPANSDYQAYLASLEETK